MFIMQLMSKLNMLLKCIILSFLSFAITTLAFAETIKKSPNDLREYEYITLENGMKVLLISDPEAIKSGSILSLDVGLNNTAMTRVGVAHLLEHMLSLGGSSKKYPQTDTFRSFLASNNGDFNAYTTQHSTTYFFMVQDAFFSEALDMFAHNFFEVKINAKDVNKERNAVDAENQLFLANDQSKYALILSELANPQHPWHNFGCGNLATLSDTTTNKVSDDLQQFYNDYYSAHNMRAIIISKQTIGQLKQLAREKYGLIEQRQTKEFVVQAPLFIKQDLAKDIRLKSNSDMNILSLLFVIPKNKNNYQVKAEEYVQNLLSDPRVGGLSNMLQQDGWITGMQAGIEEIYDERQSVFKIDFNLTEQGENFIDAITALSFKYIAAIKTDGIREDLFDAFKMADNLDFQFMNKIPEDQYIGKLIKNMTAYPPEDIIVGDYFLPETKFNAVAIKQVLDNLTYKNMLRVYIGKDVVGDKEERQTKAKYSVKNITKKIYNDFFSDIDKDHKFTIAPFVDLMPKNFNLVGKEDTQLDITPDVLVEDNKLKLWHLYDVEQKKPFVLSSFKFEISKKYVTEKTEALLCIYKKMLALQLEESSMNLSLAGIDIDATAMNRAIILHIKAFSDTYVKSMNFGLDAVFNVEDRFFNNAVTIINKQLDGIYAGGSSFDIVKNKYLSLFFTEVVDVDHVLNNINKITLKDLQEFKKLFFKQAYLEVLLHGNLSANEAKKIAISIEDKYGNKFSDQIHKVSLKNKVYKFKRGMNNIAITENKFVDQAVLKSFQADNAAIDTVVSLKLLSSIMNKYFFDELRSHDQLGYVAKVIPTNHYQSPDICFIIISPHKSVAFLDKRIDRFVREFKTKLLLMPENKIMSYRNALKKELQEKMTLEQKHNYIWNEIAFNTDNFNVKNDMIASLDAITKEDLLAIYDEMFINKETVTGISVVVTKPEKIDSETKAWLNSDNVIVDVDKFKRSLECFE